MPNVHTACWTMRVADLTGVGDRADALRSVAIAADTGLKIMGNAGGGEAFSRLLVVPEYFFAGGGAISSRSEKHAIYKNLESISAMVPDLILIAGSIAYKKGRIFTDTYNVCPILYGGEIVKKPYKAGDDGHYQVNGTFRTKTDHGKGVPIASVNGISIGLDICMDYNNDRLTDYLDENDIDPPDIHIQISGTNGMRMSGNAARIGGVHIHCDLQNRFGVRDAGASAWRVIARDGEYADTTRILPDQTQIPGGVGQLMYFTTPV